MKPLLAIALFMPWGLLYAAYRLAKRWNKERALSMSPEWVAGQSLEEFKLAHLAETECVGVSTGKRKVHAVVGQKTESRYTCEPERR